MERKWRIANGTLTGKCELDVVGIRRKIVFITNHNMCLHIRSRGAEAEQEQNPLCKNPTPNFPCPLRNQAPQSYFCPHRHGRSAQVTLPSNRVCVNMPAVTERGYQNPPIPAAATASHMCERTLCIDGLFQIKQIRIPLVQTKQYYDPLFSTLGIPELVRWFPILQ